MKIEDEIVPDVDELEDDTKEDVKPAKKEKESSSETVCEMDKEELKAAMREVQMEDRLKYTVCDRSKEECAMIIKMAQKRIKDLDSGDVKESGKETGISRY